jgi:8-oxo-dGTP diphosphatase
VTASAPELAVGAIVVRDGCLLLVQRGRGVAVGKWAPPGGRVQFGETLIQAVAREVREETGVEVRVGVLAGWVERTGTEPEPYHYVILDFFAESTGAITLTAGDDAAGVRWVPLAEVASLDLVDGLFDFLTEIGSLRPDEARRGSESSVRTQRSPARGEAADRRAAREP